MAQGVAADPRPEHPTLAPETLAPSQLLRSLGLEARKRLGQNFLASPTAVHHILGALALSADDVVVEVGAGLGTLTGYLAAACRGVLAIELDDELARHLERLFAPVESVRVVHADILEASPATLFAGDPPPFKAVGNLPYYITSAALRHVLSWQPPPGRLVVMVQHEVARRMVAGPGGMSLLSLMVQMRGVPTIVARVPAGAFVPPPTVNSAIVAIVPHDEPLAAADAEDAVFRLARAGFQQRRKMLLNSLSTGLGRDKASVGRLLNAVNIPASARAEDLNVPQWIALAQVLEAET